MNVYVIISQVLNNYCSSGFPVESILVVIPACPESILFNRTGCKKIPGKPE